MYYKCNFRLMPIDCKKNWKLSTVYDFTRQAYRTRRDQECKPTHVQLKMNCTKISAAMSHLGIMGLESRNFILNDFNFKVGHQNIETAVCNMNLFILNSHYVAWNYWQQQSRLPLNQRKQPYQTFHEKYPKIFKEIGIIISSTINLTMYEDTFKAPDKTKRLMTIIHSDTQQLKDIYNTFIYIYNTFIIHLNSK